MKIFTKEIALLNALRSDTVWDTAFSVKISAHLSGKYTGCIQRNDKMVTVTHYMADNRNSWKKFIEKTPNCIGLSRYIAITNLPTIAVFVEYLRQFLIDLNQIYRHSSVP